MQFLLIFVIAFFGAVFNDFYHTMSDKEECVNFARVLLSAFTGAILVFATTNYASKYIDERMLMLVSFISGVTGFKIFEKLQDIDLLAMFWKVVDITIGAKYKADKEELDTVDNVIIDDEIEQYEEGDNEDEET